MFVDTSAWVALGNARDTHHRGARAVLESTPADETWHTTDYIFDETVTRLRQQAGHRGALRTIRMLRTSAFVRLHPVDQTAFERAIEIFETHADKTLSFTDCTSFAVMERQKIRKAFTFDEDFRRMGFDVVPTPA